MDLFLLPTSIVLHGSSGVGPHSGVKNDLTQRTWLLQEEDIRELNNNSEHVHTIESLEAKLSSATDEIQKLEEKIKEYTTWNEKLTRDCTSISLLIFCRFALNDAGSDENMLRLVRGSVIFRMKNSINS